MQLKIERKTLTVNTTHLLPNKERISKALKGSIDDVGWVELLLNLFFLHVELHSGLLWNKILLNS